MTNIFISYASQDRAQAESVGTAFRERGWTVFLAERTIKVGADYIRVINRELRTADVVVGLWSRHAWESEWVLGECQVARERGVLVPLLLEKSDRIEVPFNRLEAVHLTDAIDPRRSRNWSDAIAAVSERVAPRLVCQEDRSPRNGSRGASLSGFITHSLGRIRLTSSLPAWDDPGFLGGIKRFLSSFEDLFSDRIRPLSLRFHTQKFEPVKDALGYFRSGRGRLLLVGEAGVGKTFTMLHMMNQLLDSNTPGELVPVYFNLTSWVEIDEAARAPSSLLDWIVDFVRPLDDSAAAPLKLWLIDQLTRNWGVNRKRAKGLIDGNQIVLCLDGLDELRARTTDDDAETARLRDRCIASINNYLTTDKASSAILCCRASTFEEVGDILTEQLGDPLVVSKLTSQDVIENLEGDGSLAVLLSVLRSSDTLMERAKLPLTLGVMRLVYMDMNEDAAARMVARSLTMSPEEWDRDLLDQYVQRCITHASETDFANKGLIRNCLNWMANLDGGDVILDQIQPSVLGDACGRSARRWRHEYKVLSVGLLSAVLAVIETIPPGLFLLVEHGFSNGWLEGVRRASIMCGLSLPLLMLLYVPAFATRKWWVMGLCFAFAWGCDYAIFQYLTHTTPEFDVLGVCASGDELCRAAYMGLVSFVAASGFFAPIAYLVQRGVTRYQARYRNQPHIDHYEIHPVEPMSWNTIRSVKGLGVGLVLVAILYLLVGPARALGIGGVLAIILTCFAGMSGSSILRVEIEPNQGMGRSLRSASLMTGIVVGSGSVILGAAYGLSFGLPEGLRNAALALCFSFVFFVFGGIPVVRQLCLGVTLWRQKLLPGWDCLPPWRKTKLFLEDLVTYKLLRRTAGGYMFRHDTLREHFRKSETGTTA